MRSIQVISSPPNAVITRRLGGRRIDAAEIQDSFFVLTLFIGCVVLSWFVFLLYDYPPMAALFEVVSATGTVGLSSGVTDAQMPTVLKLVLCVDMLLGRLEFIAWLVLFYPRTWLGRRRSYT